MLKILILTRYGRRGASSRVRFLQFLTALGTRGMSFSVQPFFDDEYVSGLYRGERTRAGKVLAAYFRRFRALSLTRRYDLIWVEKEALPWLPAALELAAMRGTPYVVDLDDAWLTMTEAAKALAVTNDTLRRLIKTGVLPAEQVVAGAPYQIRASDLASEPVKIAMARKGRPCRAADADTLPMFPDT